MEKLTPEQQQKLNAWREGFNAALKLKTDGETSTHCVDNTPERVKGYLEGQHAAFDLLETEYGLVEAGTMSDTLKDIGREKHHQGYVEGVADTKRTLLYTLIKATETNPHLKPHQASLVTELFKLINPEDTELY